MILLSICVPSFNRPEQLKRCLQSLPSDDERIEVLVRDDCSPLRDDMRKVLATTKIRNLWFEMSDSNSGFDMNFAQLIKQACGKYILFCTDDDYFDAAELSRFVTSLENTDAGLIFTPFFRVNEEIVERHKPNFAEPVSHGIRGEQIFDLILLSGLVFQRKHIPNYDVAVLAKSIYSQVFVGLCCANYGFAYSDCVIIQCAEDGRNGFDNTKDPLKSDRNHFLSNLSFHHGLCDAVLYSDQYLGHEGNLFRIFEKMYSLRSYTGLRIARSFGRKAALQYYTEMKKLGLRLGWLPTIYLALVCVLGEQQLKRIGMLGKKLYGKFRRESSVFFLY